MNTDLVAALAPAASDTASTDAALAGEAAGTNTFGETLDAELSPLGVGTSLPATPAPLVDASAECDPRTGPASDLANELAALAALWRPLGPVAVASEASAASTTATPMDGTGAPVAVASSAGAGVVADATAAIFENSAGDGVEMSVASSVDEQAPIVLPDLGPEVAAEQEAVLVSPRADATAIARSEAESAPLQIEAANTQTAVPEPRATQRGDLSRGFAAAAADSPATVSGATEAHPFANTEAEDGSRDAASGDGSSDAQTMGPDAATPADSVVPTLAPTATADLGSARAAAQLVAATNGVSHTPSPDLSGEPVPVDAVPTHVEWLAARGGGTARIALDPPNLGPVEISVSVRGDRVEVVMAAGAEAANVLQGAREALGHSLANLDLRMDRFEVRAPDSNGAGASGSGFSLTHGQSGDFARDAAEDARQRAERSDDGPNEVASPGAFGASRPAATNAGRPVRMGDAGGVDLRI